MMSLTGLILRLVVMLAASLAVAPAWQAGFYTCALLTGLTSGLTAGSLLAQWARLTRRPPYREAAPPRPADREALRHRILLDQVPVPVLFLDTEGRIHVANRAARRLFDTADHLITPPDHLLQALTPFTAPRTSDTPSPHDSMITGQIIHLAPPHGGPARSYRLSISHGASLGGVIAYMALVDIEADLNASSAETLRELLQVLGHEIMNSLTPIISLSATAEDLCLESRPPSPHDAPHNNVRHADSMALLHEAICTIRRRAEGLEEFVSRYRALSRLPPPRRRPTDLTTLLEQTARLFEARFGDYLTFTCDPGFLQPQPPDQPRPHHPSPRPHPVMMTLDATQIDHALMNLLINAAQAVSGRATPRVHLGMMAQQGIVTLSIADNGPGIPAAQAARIFDPFTSFKPDGNGIGLSLAQQIIHAHGGTIWLDPTPAPPWKSIFRIRL